MMGNKFLKETYFVKNTVFVGGQNSGHTWRKGLDLGDCCFHVCCATGEHFGYMNICLRKPIDYDIEFQKTHLSTRKLKMVSVVPEPKVQESLLCFKTPPWPCRVDYVLLPGHRCSSSSQRTCSSLICEQSQAVSGLLRWNLIK